MMLGKLHRAHPTLRGHFALAYLVGSNMLRAYLFFIYGPSPFTVIGFTYYSESANFELINEDLVISRARGAPWIWRHMNTKDHLNLCTNKMVTRCLNKLFIQKVTFLRKPTHLLTFIYLVFNFNVFQSV